MLHHCDIYQSYKQIKKRKNIFQSRDIQIVSNKYNFM